MAPLRFFVYSNLFIAACAVLMVSQTYQLLLHTAADPYVLGFVFLSTICSYSFHWYLSSDSAAGSPRSIWQQRNQIVHVVLFFVGTIGSLIFFFLLYNHWFWLLLSVIPTFLYTAPKIPHKYFRILRKIALGKTIFLAMVWMYVTTILPFGISGAIAKGDIYLFACSRFFLIYAICILFDYRDRAEDKKKGIRSLITYLNESGIRNLFVGSLLIFSISTASLLFYPFSPLVILLLFIPAIVTAALYNYSRKHSADMLYYLTLDGLMALSSVLTLLLWI